MVARPDDAATTPVRPQETLHYGPGVASMAAKPTGIQAGGSGRRNVRRGDAFPCAQPLIQTFPSIRTRLLIGVCQPEGHAELGL